MSDNPRSRRYTEIFPPQIPNRAQQPAARQGQPPAKSGSWLPPSLARRVLNRVLAKEAASHAELLEQVNRVGALSIEYERLKEEYERRLGRSDALPALRNAAKAQAYDEIDQIFENIGDQRDERRLQRLKREADLIRAEREVEELRRGPLPALPQPPKESRGSRKAAAIKAAREECEEVIAIILAGRKEEEVDDEDRQLIDDARLACRNKIQSILLEDD